MKKMIWEEQKCPITGLDIYVMPEFLRVRFDPTYYANFCRIGKGILYSAPVGKISAEGSIKFWETRAQALQAYGMYDAPYVEIRDLKWLEGSVDPEVRKVYVKYYNQDLEHGQMRAIYHINTSYATKLLTNVGMRIFANITLLHCLNDYREGIVSALSILGGRQILGSKPASWWRRLLDKLLQTESHDRQIEQLVQYIGTINWVHDQVPSYDSIKISPKFQTIYDVLKTVKLDFDMTLERMKKAQEEQEQMHKKVLQSGRLAAIGTLAAGVGHEINNPVTIIRGFAENMLEDLEDPKYQGQLKSIIAASDRIGGIVNGLRVLARTDSGVGAIFDCNEALRDTLVIVKDMFSKNGVKIVEEISTVPCTVNGVRSDFQQVLLNLIINARDAVCDKKIDDGQVIIKTEIQNNMATITCTDNGVGIAPEIMDKIFDAFFTTRPPGKGAGLGLAMVESIIRSMNGKIEVDSSLGKGTSMKIILPYVEKKSSV